MKILVTGATGLIGRSLCRSLTSENHSVVALSRRPERASDLPAGTVYKWDPLAGPPTSEALEGVESVYLPGARRRSPLDRGTEGSHS